ncbi:MAG: TVP38/TMEM64 family protein, partial [Peptostreptococcaceae bacterium]
VLYSLAEHKILATIMGFVLITIETFAPILPLMAIVLANSVVLGMWLGFFISWLGSSIASILLYYAANKFSKIKIFKKYEKNDRISKIKIWIKKQGFSSIFIAYSCPFIPDFLVTISSGFVEIDIKTYALAMLSGKFVMFLFLSYIGDDLVNLFSNPIKIIILLIVISTSWIVGNRVNNKIHE